MTETERKLLVKAAENLASMLSWMSHSSAFDYFNRATVRSMADELLKLSNAVEIEHLDNLPVNHGG